MFKQNKEPNFLYQKASFKAYQLFFLSNFGVKIKKFWSQQRNTVDRNILFNVKKSIIQKSGMERFSYLYK